MNLKIIKIVLYLNINILILKTKKIFFINNLIYANINYNYYYFIELYIYLYKIKFSIDKIIFVINLFTNKPKQNIYNIKFFE